MWALIALGVVLLLGIVWRPFMRIIGARSPSEELGHEERRVAVPFLRYLFVALCLLYLAWIVVVIIGGFVGGAANPALGFFKLDYDVMLDLFGLPFRF